MFSSIGKQYTIISADPPETKTSSIVLEADLSSPTVVCTEDGATDSTTANIDVTLNVTVDKEIPGQ